jgi:hypothetical protein
MKCDLCGLEIRIGDWAFCPHGAVRRQKPFPSFWDEHVSHDGPVYVDSLAKWNRMMRENRMEIRDSPKQGELTARRDRNEQIMKERERYAR